MTAIKIATTPVLNRIKKIGDQTAFSGAAKGTQHVVTGTLALATTNIDEAGDTIILCEVPGNATILRIELAADDMDSHSTPTLTFDLGLVKDVAWVSSTTVTCTSVDVDCYGTEITLGQAATAFTDYAHEVRDINVAGQTVALDGGETTAHSDPRFIALTVDGTAATAVAGDVSYRVSFLVP